MKLEAKVGVFALTTGRWGLDIAVVLKAEAVAIVTAKRNVSRLVVMHHSEVGVVIALLAVASNGMVIGAEEVASVMLLFQRDSIVAVVVEFPV